MSAITLLVAVLLVLQDLPRQAPDEPPEEAVRSEPSPAQPRLFRQLAGLMRVARELGDWETHHAWSLAAMERVFARNGWDSEADEFALEVLREVDAIPPWAPQARLDRLMELFSDRYALDEAQEQHFRAVLLEESSRLFARQSGRIMQYAPELIRTRAAQQPIRPEQVARWATLATPVLEDARRTNRRVVERLLHELDPTQQQMLRSDLEAHVRRLDVVQQMAQSWQRGEWRPEDWGLEEDPIQTGVAAAAAEGRAPSTTGADASAQDRAEQPSAAAGDRESAPTGGGKGDRSTPESVPTPTDRAADRGRSAEGDDHAWAVYVREFVRKYSLDAEQQRSAWRIYDSVTEQRKQLERRTGVRTAQAPPPMHPAIGPAAGSRPATAHDRLFEQLRRRLDRLPTRAQRAAVESVGE